MIDKDLAKFISMADDHYWDSLEKERDIIIQHINAIAIEIIKNNCEEYNKTLELYEMGQCPKKYNQSPELTKEGRDVSDRPE